MMRVAFLVVLIVLATMVPWWIFGFVAGYYAWRYEGAELIVLGLSIDAFYHAFGMVPVYLLLTTTVLILVTLIKPQVTFS